MSTKSFALEDELTSPEEAHRDSFRGSLNADFDEQSGHSDSRQSSAPPETDSRFLDACIYLWEGENNDHFEVHPRTKRAIRAYRFVHSRWMKLLDLTAAVTLLLLAVIEPPSIVINSVKQGKERDRLQAALLIVQLTTELICFLILWTGVVMRMMWMGVQHYFSHIGLLIRFCVLILMLVRTISTPFCVDSWCFYFDLIRAFRPVFIIDSYYCSSVRRTVRQIIKALKSAMFVILFIIAFVMVAALLALILFNDSRNNEFFSDYLTSLVSLTVLFTTCNSPDVILPYYSQYWWAPAFFILFLCIGHYMMKALLLAVIFESFSTHDRDKFCRLYLHQREALFHTFYALCRQPTELQPQRSSTHVRIVEPSSTSADTSRATSTSHVTFEQFRGLMRFYRPKWSTVNVWCFFKCLDCNKTGSINLPEFLRFWELRDACWEPETAADSHRWRGYVWNGIPTFMRIAETRYFDETRLQGLEWTVGGLFRFFINLSLFGFFVLLVYEAAWAGNPDTRKTCRALEERSAIYWSKVSFVILYAIEAGMKTLTIGIKGYFTASWNVFDFVCVVAGIVDVILDAAVVGGVKVCDENQFGPRVIFKFVFCIRVIRLFRLVEISQKSREAVSALFAVMHRMLAVALVILLMFYWLSVVGMDFFAHKVYPGCCQNYSEPGLDVASYFAGNRNSSNQYYLNNFDSIFQSYVSLFILMVVNNWYVAMDGFTSATGTQWTRLYFVFVYIVSLVVFDTVVSVIIDSFMFRIRTKQQGIEPTDIDLGFVSVNPEEDSESSQNDPDGSAFVYYRGTYHPSKADVKLQRYEDDIRPLLSRQERLHRWQRDRPHVQTYGTFGSEGPVFVENHY